MYKGANNAAKPSALWDQVCKERETVGQKEACSTKGEQSDLIHIPEGGPFSDSQKKRVAPSCPSVLGKDQYMRQHADITR